MDFARIYEDGLKRHMLVKQILAFIDETPAPNKALIAEKLANAKQQ